MGLNDFELDTHESIALHDCPKFNQIQETSYGPAVTNIEFFPDIKEWVMHNGEYGTYPIFFCPFCGKLLKRQF